MSLRHNRRRFLQASGVGLGYFLTAPAFSGARILGVNERVRIAGIGVGGSKGSSDIDQAGSLGDVVALCDIDDRMIEAKAKKFEQAKKYFDFRKMLDEMGKQIDGVVVCTPDHMHAPASMMAMRMGKHVYCQKPLTHTVYEARLMRETAKKMGVATQMGNQGTALNGLRRAVEIIQAGMIGDVTEAHVWTDRPVWPQAPTVTSRPPECPVPSYVHWDEFIGPAPMRPYAEYESKDGKAKRKGAYHDFNWRGWWDFGTGALGDMACHTANMAFMALKLGYPTSVVAEVVNGLNPETYPAGARVRFDFPARESMVPVKFYWYEGKSDGKKLLPSEELVKRAIALTAKDGKAGKLVDSGSIIVGTKGMIYSPSDYGAVVLFDPVEQFREVNTKKPEKLPGVEGNNDVAMKKEWIEAIKGGPAPMSNFDYAAALTETILLGNIAIRLTGQSLAWDGPAMKFTNNESANKFLHKEYRAGWKL
ncbi:MAG: Gfo/Idh/MocA family oxidoreductase [Gemmataceae bacterium]|nr:Gfo/Idh/MocA family oxidoreductase [Gemmataceae bacterium]